jgi:hypothetical protein
MGELINLNPDGGIPPEIARDSEVTAAIASHVAAVDPHPVYLTQTEGDTRYRQTTVQIPDTDVASTIARDSEVAAAIANHIAEQAPHPGGFRVFKDGADSVVSCFYFGNAANNRAANWQLAADGSAALWGSDGVVWTRKLHIAHNNVVTTGQPPSLHGAISIGGSKNSYSGINFADGFNSPVFMQHVGANIHGMWAPAGAPNGWTTLYNEGSFRVFNSGAQTDGSFVGLEKGLGSYPGFPNNRLPTIRTDFSALFFSIGGQQSAQITSSGTYTAVSDKNRKENAVFVDSQEILAKLKNIPIYRYNFIGEDSRIQRMGCYAQDFYAAFGLGGDEEIDADDSPTTPSKMLAPADAIGVCMAAIKALACEVKDLKSMLNAKSSHE